MMMTTGAVSLSVGMVFAPLLAHGNTQVIIGYRIAFATSVVAFVAASYTFSLQARDLQRWNVVQFSQPLLSLVAIVALWRLRLLTLDVAMVDPLCDADPSADLGLSVLSVSPGWHRATLSSDSSGHSRRMA